MREIPPDVPEISPSQEQGLQTTGKHKNTRELCTIQEELADDYSLGSN